ncbi:murein hydrolase activator EnvC [Lewinella sp. 4G2]|uniref:murein hydrolase activator EnvC family protein n=1 Tax=Lewinella sp. 4G2 TaxID=1803372 RepID=UPI0007B46706|nr:peptidoglycan DD-metalloendopeptidase family protein [Lewinella sp. 4G2]OAV43379.1 hypothetical protein A3850_002200 [Lewinella sp. 4G2]
MKFATPLYVLLLLLLLPVGSKLAAQSDLQQRKQRIERELKRTGRELKATQSRKGAALTQAGQLKTQIAQRQELIATLEEESLITEQRLYRDSTAVASLTDDLQGIVDEYASTLRAANRARLLDGWMTFLFNAKGINDAFRRAIYLRQYRAYRTRQARIIRQTKDQLSGRVNALRAEREYRDSLLTSTADQGAILTQELKIQDRIVSKLSVSERALLKKVKRQEAMAATLRRQVTSAINKDVARKTKPRASTSTRRTGTAAKTTPVGGKIINRKGRLGWPVEGRIVKKFGRQPHPDVPSIMVNSQGVDIQGGKQSRVSAIFEGRVVEISNQGGGRYMLLMSHGGFYSVYSNLEFPQVKSGATLKTGQQLGLTAADGSPLHFELWRGKAVLNPEVWLN